MPSASSESHGDDRERGDRVTVTVTVTVLVLAAALGLALPGCGDDGPPRRTRRATGPPPPAPERAPQGKRLEPIDLFGPTSLTGHPPRSFAWSPTGDKLYYLRPSAKDARVLDLWRFDVATRKAAPLVRSADLRPKRKVALTEEQKAARERRRIRHHGITRFQLGKKGQTLLFRMGALTYVYRLTGDGAGKPTKLFAKPAGEIDARLSPDETRVAFVRRGDLWLRDLATGKDKQLTRSAAPGIKNGLAEFIAQEELKRFRGFWWSVDGKSIAMCEVDERKVLVITRPEYDADRVKIVTQRYPKVGTANARVRLGIIDAATGGRPTWVNLGPPADHYIARVAWVGPRLAVQVLSRDQRSLSLHLVDAKTGKGKVVLEERAKDYVNLHEDLRPLPGEQRFVWSSERGGAKRLYLYDWSGKLLRALGPAGLIIERVAGIDAKGGAVFAVAATDRGRQRQLYRLPLAGGKGKRVTKRRGWHGVEMAKRGGNYVDRWSDTGVPTRVSVHGPDGKRLVSIDENPATALAAYERASHRFVDIPTARGQTLNGLMYQATNLSRKHKHPAIIYVYGGPHGQTVARRFSRSALWFQYFAQRGYIVLTVDGRGTHGRGKRFEAGLFQKMGVADVEDVTSAADYLARQPLVDAQRIGLFGWSYGGYLTTMTLLRTGRRFAAGVAIAPVTDWRLYDTAYTERYLDHPERAPKAYAQSRAAPLAAKLETHLMLIHGMSDDNVLLQHTLQLAEALQQAGKRFDMMLYPNKKHGLRGTKTRVHLFGLITRYFARHLRP